MISGFFVAIEGTEGAGKSSLAKGLGDRFLAEGESPVLVREPGGTLVAERIRAVLLDPEAEIEPASELFLFLAARADLVTRVIRPALAAGKTVLADRFQLSTEAYQCGGRGIEPNLFRAANRAATGGLVPDLTLVLDLPLELGFDRLRKAGQVLDRIEQASPEFHARVAAVFRNATGRGIVHLDATLSSEQVLRNAWVEIEAHRAEARAAVRD